MANKNFIVTLVVLFTLLMTVTFSISSKADNPQAETAKPNVPMNPEIQFHSFLSLAQDLEAVRESRRIPVGTFVSMAKDPETIILDTRSKAAFDDVHVTGAVHLNFSDFTDEKLAKTIPSKKTRILIYCNNNFVDDLDPVPGGGIDAARLARLLDKSPALALNIPTFINLHGYGYENVYELADRLNLSESKLSLTGKAVNNEN